MQGTLVAMVDASIREHPDRVAVVDVDGTEITYRALDRRAEASARLLREHGVGRHDRVGVCRRKSAGTVADLLGIMRVGAAFVPVDSTAPAERNRRIFQDCEVAGILADEGIDLGLQSIPVFAGDERPEGSDRGTERGDDPDPTDLAYILYTSGSTGHPKGVCLEHRNAVSFVDWCRRTFQASPDDRCSSHAPFHFDLSVLDLWMPLTSGGAVVLIDEQLAKDPRGLPRFIAERRITNWYSVPSILSLMAEHGRLSEHGHESLRVVCFAGEVFPIPGLRALRDLWPEPEFWNLYGPTETNVCTAHRLPQAIPADRGDPYPIGRCCDHCEIRIVDDAGAEVEPGTVGRIVCRGGPVMRCYWGVDPGETASFVLLDGDRWYDTGDLGGTNASGEIVFHGRRDRMVKRHGYRIELGEIEAGLDRASRLSESAVFAVTDVSGVVIHAAVVAAGEETASVIELRRHCASVLPSYMIPDRFHVLESLPRTSTGKVDHPRLREELVSCAEESRA